MDKPFFPNGGQKEKSMYPGKWKILPFIPGGIFLCLWAGGLLLMEDPWAKAIWSVMGGMALLTIFLVYRSFRRETVSIADMLSFQIRQAVRGVRPKTEVFSQETISSRLSLEISRLAEITWHQARENECQKKELQGMISDIAHQLRAPAANMTLYSDTLAAGDLTEEQQRKFLGILRDQAQKLEFLVSALVKMSRLESGGIQIAATVQSLEDTLEEAAAQVIPAAGEKGLVFKLSCPPGLKLPHDRKWTVEAFCNLLDNAVKYTHCGKITVTAETLEVYTRIQVADTGIGTAMNSSVDALRLFSLRFV